VPEFAHGGVAVDDCNQLKPALVHGGKHG
jgi:hypothetical protein